MQISLAPAMARPEQVIQKAVVHHLRARGVDGLVAIHVPNGGYRMPVEAKIMQSLGVVAGVPDLLLWHAGKSFALELKSDAGRISDSQADMLRHLSEAGVSTAVAHGIDKAVACLEEWGLLRGKAALSNR